MVSDDVALSDISVDEEAFGHRDDRGNWAPRDPLEYPPVFVWPPRPGSFLRWLVRDYVLSWNLVYAGVATVIWMFLSPTPETAQALGLTWIMAVLLRNTVLVVVFYGAWHWWFYMRRAQGATFKFNPRWPKTDSSTFVFRQQTRDNVLWTMASGVPIWTAFEVLMLWAQANGMVTPLSLTQNPVWFGILMLMVPAFRDLHFYLVHRLLHIPVLYRTVHRLHHHNTNPGPWSGMAMHPVEHLLYFTGVLVHFVVPAHPVHILFQLAHAGMAPAPGHAGFGKIVLGQDKPRVMNIYAYNHYLHHKYFECNYAEGVIPLDKWFGTFHDGTAESHQAMRARLKQRRATSP